MKTKDELPGVPTPTIYDTLMPIIGALQKSLDVGRGSGARERTEAELPAWCWNIIERLRKTIFKPVIELEPKGAMDWRKYGRMIGLITRYFSFVDHEAEETVRKSGLENLDEVSLAKLEALCPEDQARAILEKHLNRPLKENECLETLMAGMQKAQLEFLTKLRGSAENSAIRQSPENLQEFSQGVHDGITLFLDTGGTFAGDKGRTTIYFEFLISWPEIEEMRRQSRTRRDLYEWILRNRGVVLGDQKWFNDICDDIRLTMKPPGRPSTEQPE